MNTAPFTPYECSLGTVIAHDGGSYLIARPSGQVEGYRANGEPSSSAVEADLANPPAPPPPPARELSKLTLKRRLDEMGKWSTFRSVLQGMPSVWDEFVLAQEIRTDDPVFTTHAVALKLAVGLTQEQFESLLAP
jgi:hypothetical protein